MVILNPSLMDIILVDTSCHGIISSTFTLDVMSVSLINYVVTLFITQGHKKGCFTNGSSSSKKDTQEEKRLVSSLAAFKDNPGNRRYRP